MSDQPTLVHEHSHTNLSPDRDFSASCPFCVISSSYPTVSPSSLLTPSSSEQLDPDKVDPPSFVLFSTEHVIAFLDIMPLTRGHVLVAPRKHRVKVGDLSPDESAEIGRVLPVLARSVIKAVLPDIPHEEADYNVVQNNGPGAAQVVPHVHFHIVPRPPLNYTPSPLAAPVFPDSHSAPKKKYTPNPPPSGRQRTAIMFGRGMRDDLDWEDAAVLVGNMRRAVQEEWEVSFGTGSSTDAAGTCPEAKRGEVEGDAGANIDSVDSSRRRGAWKV